MDHAFGWRTRLLAKVRTGRLRGELTPVCKSDASSGKSSGSISSVPNVQSGAATPAVQDAHELLELARDNQRKHRIFQKTEHRLMMARTLAECVQIITTSAPSRHGWDAVHLTLVDADYSLRRILSGPHGDLQVDPAVSFVDTRDSLDLRVQRTQLPQMDSWRLKNHEKYFGRARLERVCVLPLCRGVELIGSLHIASRNPDRFAPSADTDFLQRLGAIMAISVEAVSARDQLELVSLTDPLTGICNRRFFDRRVSEEILRSRREGTPLSMLFIDVDHFKSANDVCGHSFGDKLLRDIAAAIANEVRVSDVLCRYGGDEFACLLGGTGARGASEIGERIRDAVEYLGTSSPREGLTPVTVSIGVASVSDGSFDAQELLRRADEAVYTAKDSGRNRVVTYERATQYQSPIRFRSM